ncbi:YdeI/OmpD-associated family protein [Nesterenkonia haasae]|uniref:YdeI/OmpD-associated family protein n=1 Tax=Nesterenkonia haasae TaxID=2587813 RepID=UPI00139174E8|nr:YdeI/OmpD-associated family protein [Nesterenkonia haasae]NDK32159.1 hypothetical protein [Nesterenkonia haasae]
MNDEDRLHVRDVAEWRAWLNAHEDASAGVKLVLAKKGVTTPTSLTYAQALEEALCSGWIDGRRNRIDDVTFLQHFTPRRRRSMWSQRNVALVEKLTAAGRMRPRGKAEVDRAKADGRWAGAYAGQAAMELPDDLAHALQEHPQAALSFNAMGKTAKYQLIHQVVTAETTTLRQRRIRRIVSKLEQDPGNAP